MALPSTERFVSEYEKKKVPIVEIVVPTEVESKSEYVKELNKKVELKEPILDDVGQVIMDNANPEKVEVVLPLTKQEMDKALHLKVAYSFRWLAEWAKRLLKIASGRVEYHYRMQK